MIGPTSNRCASFASYFIENQPLVKCVEPVVHQWLHWWRTPDFRLVSLGDIQLTAKLQVANRRSISNLYQTQVWYLKISDLGEAEVWYLVVNERLKVHY